MTAAAPLEREPTADAAQRPVPAVLKIVAAVVVAVLVVVSLVQARKLTAQLGDFGAYYRAGQAVVAGRTPYALSPKFGAFGGYMYCPAFAHVVCRPLAWLPYVSAMRVFLAVNWMATAGVVALSVRLVGGRSPTVRFVIGAVACAAVGSYLWADLHNGQVGTLLLLACLGWISLTLAGRPVAGGLCLSLAVGLKIYPLLLGPYLLLRRRWWPGLIGLAVGLAVQFVVPVLFVGPSGMLPLHREWLRFCMDTQVVEQTIRTGNQSLLGVLARLPWISDGVHVASDRRLALLERGYPLVVLAVTAAIYGAIVVRRATPAVAVSVLLVWMTVAAPRAWTFNLAAELPAAVLVAAVVVRRGPGWPWGVLALAGLIFAAAFDTNRRLLPPVRWHLGPQLLWDKHFLAAVLLAAVVARLAPAALFRSTAAGQPDTNRTI